MVTFLQVIEWPCLSKIHFFKICYDYLMIGKEIKITFWDHSSSSKLLSGAILCTVWGEITGENDITFEIMSWRAHSEDESTADDNSEVYTILKSTITECIVFGKGKKVKVK